MDLDPFWDQLEKILIEEIERNKKNKRSKKYKRGTVAKLNRKIKV
jgi:hypothetical protein